MPSPPPTAHLRTGKHATRGYHIMAKPIGPICNLDCAYCYYLKKEDLYAGNQKWRMLEATLEEFTRQYIASQPRASEIQFSWQGGEPTLLGIEFFAHALTLQKKHARPHQKITNTIQTNGTLLDDDWATFLKQNSFLVGISIDGPAEIHDKYRLDKAGRSSHHQVIRGLQALQRHQVEFNVLCVVNHHNAEYPLEIYDFLKSHGTEFIQFIPIVEPIGLGSVTDRSVTAAQYGRFLCTIFDHWVRHDVGRVFVQIFDTALAAWCGREPALCIFAETCGGALVIEHNGDVYSCDHFVDPQHILGNVNHISLPILVDSPQQLKFGCDKRDALPDYCRECEVRFACNGACPKDRFIRTPTGEPGLNYLCAGYRQFFNHIQEPMKQMANFLRAGLPADSIMAFQAAHAPSEK